MCTEFPGRVKASILISRDYERIGPDSRLVPPHGAADSSAGHSISPEDSPVWLLSPVERNAAIVAVIAALVARLQAFLPGYSIDDFAALVDRPDITASAFAQGRTLVPFLRNALIRLDALPPQAAVLSCTLLTIGLIALGLAACRLWGLSNRPLECTTVLLLATLHPYQAEIFTFRTGSYAVAAAVLLTAFGLVSCFRSRTHLWLSVLALTAALMLYQAVLNYAAVILLFCVVYRLALPRLPYPRSNAIFFRSQITFACASVAVYFVLITLINRLAGISMHSRGTLLTLPELPARAGLVLNQLKVIFASGEPIFPIATKLVLIAGLGIGFGLHLLQRRGRIELRTAGAFAIAAAAGIPLSIGMVAVLSLWWPVPRVFAHSGYIWAGVFALAVVVASEWSRRWLVACTAVAVFSFIGINNYVFNDQFRANIRDLAKANRIILRLESLPDFRLLKGVVLDGGYWAYGSPIDTVQGDMNISAFGAAWAKLPLLNEASGYRFNSAPDPVKQMAAEYCKTAPVWPADKALTVLESYAVVCLER